MTATALAPAPVDDLERALVGFHPVPERYRSADLARAEAQQLLGCDEETLSHLVRRGLPATGGPGRERFDSRDVFNLGLYGGGADGVTGQMFRLALRWMRGSTESLVSARRSVLTVGVSCPLPGGCGADPLSSVAAPEPRRYGGTLDALTGDPADARRIDALRGDTVATHAPELTVTSTVRTVGELSELRAAGARDAMQRFLDADLRWIRMPEGIGGDVDLMLTRGIASCASASLWVAQMCRDAGVPATTREGWVAGMQLTHAWVEVRDTDGIVKIVDPIFALFAALVPGAHPAFRDPAVALTPSRLIPSGRPGGAPLVRHRCGGYDVPVRPGISIQSRPIA